MRLTRSEISASLAETVLDAMDEGLAVFDRHDRMRYCNRAFASMWELPDDPPHGINAALVAAAIERRSTGRLPSGLREHLEDPAVECELDIELADDHFLSLSVQPVLQRGRPRGRLWRCHDLTLQKRSELAMLHAQKLESLGVLAGGIAHDFNNLLSSILGHSELGLGELPADSPAAESFRAIGKAAERASELTQQLLAYAGKGTVLVEPVKLSHLVAEVVDLVRVSIPQPISIELDLEPEIPPIIADATQVRQIAMNLLLNASEAILDRGTISVATGTRRVDQARIEESLHDPETAPGDFVFLRVGDTGEGMDEETLTRIFDPFFSTKFTGRGLGLAGVLGIVRGHKGLLEVRSRPGAGTTFTVHLPQS